MFIFRSTIWNRLRCLFDKQLVVGCATGTFISQTFLRDFGMRLSIPLNYVVLFVFAIMIEKVFQISEKKEFYIAVLVTVVDYLLVYPLLADEKRIKALEALILVLYIVLVTKILDSPFPSRKQISADEDCDQTYDLYVLNYSDNDDDNDNDDDDYVDDGNNCDIEYEKSDYDTESESEDDTEDDDYVDDEDSEDVDFDYDDENDDENHGNKNNETE